VSAGERSRGLGRGLQALLGEGDEPPAGPSGAGRSDGVRLIPMEWIEPNPDQPRKRFDEDSLEELAQSIQEKGVLQPILVRPAPNQPDKYQIVAGERRWRAAQRAHVHDVPCVVRELTDRETLELAIVENVQRADLNAIEEARAYRELVDTFGHTQERVAQAVGKSRVHVANTLRLLTFPQEVIDLVSQGRLSAGHARAVAGAADPAALAREAAEAGLSVREVERLAKMRPAPDRKTRGADPEKDADTRALEADLAARLGLDVDVRHSGGKGELRIRYSTLEQLDDLCRRLSSGGRAR